MNELYNPPDNIEEAQKWYETNFANTIDSDWGFLREATWANYIHAGELLQDLANYWTESHNEPSTNDGEIWHILNLKYRLSASGPLLAATLIPSFAINSFINVCAHNAFIVDGLSRDALSYALHGFDKQSFQEKINAIIKLSGASDKIENLKSDINELVIFRNSTVHDNPVHNISAGFQVALKNRQIKHAQYITPQGLYPTRLNDNLPLKLSHARKSISTHDQFVEHILTTASEKFIKGFYQQKSPTDSSPPKIANISDKIWIGSEELSIYWNDVVVPWCNNISPEDTQEFIEQLQSKIKENNSAN